MSSVEVYQLHSLYSNQLDLNLKTLCYDFSDLDHPDYTCDGLPLKYTVCIIMFMISHFFMQLDKRFDLSL